jgi:hypothetical protein
MAAVVAGLVALVVVLVVNGSSGARGAASPDPNAYAPPPPGGWGGASSTTSTPVTVGATTVLTTPPTAAPLPAVDKPVSAAGSVFAPPPTPDVRTERSPNDCRSLVDQGWQALDCQTATGPGGAMTYLIEVNPEPSFVATHVYVFRRTATGAEQVVLEALDDTGRRFDTSEVEGAVAPIGAGGAPVIVMGFPQLGGGLTSVEVVTWPGVVAFHVALNGGVVASSPGQLDTWAQTGAGGAYVHDRIVQGALGWHITGEEEVGDDDVPTVSILA